MKKLIYAEDLLSSVRDDPSINGANFRKVKQHIEEAPDAVQHGRWVEDTAYDNIACTECGHMWNIIDNCTETFNYCPNCGARMDGEEDG